MPEIVFSCISKIIRYICLFIFLYFWFVSTLIFVYILCCPFKISKKIGNIPLGVQMYTLRNISSWNFRFISKYNQDIFQKGICTKTLNCIKDLIIIIIVTALCLFFEYKHRQNVSIIFNKYLNICWMEISFFLISEFVNYPFIDYYKHP